MPRIIPPRIKTSEFVKTLAWFNKMNKEQQDLVFSKLAGGESLRFAKIMADQLNINYEINRTISSLKDNIYPKYITPTKGKINLSK